MTMFNSGKIIFKKGSMITFSIVISGKIAGSTGIYLLGVARVKSEFILCVHEKQLVILNDCKKNNGHISNLYSSQILGKSILDTYVRT